MKRNEELQNGLLELDVKILNVYLLIIVNFLYLIIFYKERAGIIDELLNTNYQKKYPDTSNYIKIIVIILLFVNGIFLYYSYQDLKESVDLYNKTGDNTSLEQNYISFNGNLLQLVATILIFYNVFIKEAGVTTVITK
ncbi:MAG TPA: hypothetical protein GXZ95_02660 [Mollicutes bacterium]|nr:hypothetical protein [Mollicutes bacterium]